MRISDSSSDVCSSDRALVVGQDRGGLGVVGGQAGAHGFLGVVGAPLELGAAAVVADPGNLGLLVALVVAGAAAGAGVAPGDAVHQDLLVHLHLDDRMPAHALPLHHVAARTALRGGARNATTNEVRK